MNNQMSTLAKNLLAPTDGFLQLENEWTAYIENCNRYSILVFATNQYNHFKVSTLPLLRTLLITAYGLSNEQELEIIFKPSKLTFKRSNIIKPYYFNSATAKENTEQLGYTVEKHLTEYINLIERYTDIKISYAGHNKYKKRYVAYNDWILFSVIFTYYDGRDYSKNIKYIKTPRFQQTLSCSKESYQLALKQVLKLIDQDPYFEYHNDLFFELMQLQNIDKHFKFFKINKMNQTRKKFYESNSLQEIYKSLDLEYEEVINLASIFDAEVFKNDDFINECLSSAYIDPFFVFIYFFRFYMLKNKFLANKDNYFQNGFLQKHNSKNEIEKIHLKKLISISKTDTLQYIKTICEPGNNSNTETLCEEDLLFLKNYFFENHESLINYSQTSGSILSNQEHEYMDYLFDKVIKIIPKYSKDSH